MLNLWPENPIEGNTFTQKPNLIKDPLWNTEEDTYYTCDTSEILKLNLFLIWHGINKFIKEKISN